MPPGSKIPESEPEPVRYLNLKDLRKQAEAPITPQAAAAAKQAHETSMAVAAAKAGRGAATGYLGRKADATPLDFKTDPTGAKATANVDGLPKPQ